MKTPLTKEVLLSEDFSDVLGDGTVMSRDGFGLVKTDDFYYYKEDKIETRDDLMIFLTRHKKWVAVAQFYDVNSTEYTFSLNAENHHKAKEIVRAYVNRHRTELFPNEIVPEANEEDILVADIFVIEPKHDTPCAYVQISDDEIKTLI